MNSNLIFGMTWEQIQALQQGQDIRPKIHICDCQDPTCNTHQGTRCTHMATETDTSGAAFCKDCTVEQRCGHCGRILDGSIQRCSNDGFCSVDGQPERTGRK